ncbi:MAG: filamentous hemagglutinin N-terminal domain-containing protein [Nostocales cyanobacterium]|nr:MAG: filamentous hemagglutinin N-terminal domain-containing protein [Nostocales cyanobacterium]
MKFTKQKQKFYTQLVLTILWLISGLIMNKSVSAQITPDNTLGTESSVVNRVNEIKDLINGGATRGGNLFHSFQEFNVGENRSVYFGNPTGIENILTRVTGGNVSNILGTLGVEGTANLFLINPNGIYFGKDAVLDIRGSFTATTADEIKLGADGLFSATNPESSNLLTVQPGALFRNAIKNQISEIRNEGNLQVDAGKNITFFSANLINTGGLTAPGGIIQLTGTENLQVRGNIETNTLLLDTKNLTVGEDDSSTMDKGTLEGLSGNTNLIFQAINDITINPLVDNNLNLTDGSGDIIFTADADDNGIGNFQMDGKDTIKTNGRNVEIKGISLDVGDIDTSAEMGGGNITLTAEGDIFTQNLNSSSVSFSESGNGGAIFLSTNKGNISTQYLYSYKSSYLGNGNGGLISISTNQGNIFAVGLNSSSSSYSGNGNGGNITLNTSQGYIHTQFLDSSSSSSQGKAGNGGEIVLQSKEGDIIFKQYLNSSSYSNSGAGGKGGDIFLVASGDIFAQDIYSSTNSFLGSGENGGDIFLVASGDIITEYLNSSSYSFSGSGGNGGGISLVAGGNIFTQDIYSHSNSESGTANGGAITLSTNKGNISTTNLESYSSSSSGIGNGGSITLSSKYGDIFTANLNSSSYSFSETVNGGAITVSTNKGNITTGNLNSSSKIYSGNAGNGGAITVSTNEGDIYTQKLETTSSARTGEAGNGGAITLSTNKGNIITHDLISESFSSLLANSGNGGAISISSNQGDIFTGNLDSSSASFGAKGGNGGNIFLSSNQGDIFTGNLDSSSASFDGKGGNGGNIFLSSNQGNINTQDLESYSYSKSEDTRNGGGIFLTSGGYITGTVFSSFSVSESKISGKGGNVTLAAKNQITDLEILTLSSSSQSGDVQVNGFGDLSVINTDIVTSKTLTIKNPLTDENIIINVGGVGQSGNVNITGTGNITFQDSRIESDTRGSDPAGNVNITSPSDITFNNSQISSKTNSTGSAGNIQIEANKLTLTDTSEISASTTANGKAGDITLNASKMELAGIVGVFAETQGEAPAGTLKLNPYQNQPNLDITLFPKSRISASTTAAGKGGDLIITAPENINISGQGKLEVESTGTGDAGNISITTQNLNITDGVEISASTINNGKGGNINLKANTFTATNGAQFLTTSSGNAQAGNINLIVKDNITLDGTDTGIFANTTPGSTGKSGSITIDPQTLIIRNGAGIGVNSQGRGEGGDVSITAGTLSLDNQAFISAETANSQGGNINLTNNLLLMRNQSRITATAGTEGAGGNGGNININSPLIVAFPNENSDITANASEGNGGNINITTQALFGLEFRPQQTSKSDITASSQFGIAGNVQINRPDVDPTSGLLELPGNVIDIESLNKDVCAIKDGKIAGGSSFIITGKGGLPADTNELISNSPAYLEWEKNTETVTETKPSSAKVTQRNKNEIPDIREAQGWIMTPDGRVILTANASQVTLQSHQDNLPDCQ